ncbi:hypothetical protein, partial [Parabacteroides distasonis]|uniref:hypothetical protein n=1 Tax=Parabacteroides distasonis TaxID=823 RepID=UPI0019D5EFF7
MPRFIRFNISRLFATFPLLFHRLSLVQRIAKQQMPRVFDFLAPDFVRRGHAEIKHKRHYHRKKQNILNQFYPNHFAILSKAAKRRVTVSLSDGLKASKSHSHLAGVAVALPSDCLQTPIPSLPQKLSFLPPLPLSSSGCQLTQCRQLFTRRPPVEHQDFA